MTCVWVQSDSLLQSERGSLQLSLPWGNKSCLYLKKTNEEIAFISCSASYETVECSKIKCIYVGIAVRKFICVCCFDSFLNAEAIVALNCGLTACVQFSAPPNTKAFKPHKLGTRGFSRMVLRMSLFSNTVMITLHQRRKCREVQEKASSVVLSWWIFCLHKS